MEPPTATRATATRVLWLWADGCTTHAHHVLRRHADQRPRQRRADVDVAAVAAANATVGERLHEHLQAGHVHARRAEALERREGYLR